MNELSQISLNEMRRDLEENEEELRVLNKRLWWDEQVIASRKEDIRKHEELSAKIAKLIAEREAQKEG
ncbi:MAG: hypothetical protein NUW01_11445 [Gemmatimonadaceae bacterium]|nr:hypothetical protein [Gemmatimonadaceae bacterium]